MGVLGRGEITPGMYQRRMLLVSDDGGATWACPGFRPLAHAHTHTHAERFLRPQAQPDRRRAPGGELVNPLPQGNQLTAIDMVSNASGWAAGTHGTILETQNAGATWLNQTSRTTANLFAVAAVNRRYAWAVGMDGLILRTSNGGLTWQQQTAGTTASLFGVCAISARQAWVVGTVARPSEP